MEKGLSSIRGGRLKVAVVAMVCVLAIVALPAIAFGADAPVAGSTVTNSTVKVVWDAGVTLRATGASIKINGTAYYTAVSGTTCYAFASLTDGLKNVTASARNSSGVLVTSPGWSFTVSAPPKFGAVVPGNMQTLTTTPTAISVGVSDNTGVTTWSATVNGSSVATGTLAGGKVSLGNGYKALCVSGANVVAVTIGDAAANSVTKSWTFNIVATGTSTCKNCHAQTDRIGFVGTDASGHDTVLDGTLRGGKSLFDGSQGVTLHWTAVEAFTITSVKDPDAVAGFAPGASFSLGQTGVVTAQWNLPTKGVFWPVVDDVNQPAPASAKKGLTWTSVITCEDCHTGYTGQGPHGADANAGLDPAYPASYSRGVLTKKVTAGENVIGGTGAVSTSGIGALATLNPASGANLPNGYLNGTTGADAVICAKCHRLMFVMPAGAGTGTSGLAWNTVEGANTAHDSHHQNATDNSAQCVNCHIAVPHGWKAPRLLVDAEEGEEYSPDAFLWENNVKVREGMNSLAGLNNHLIVGADGMAAYVTGSGSGAVTVNFAHEGTVIWDESQCSACGDHYGEDQKFWTGVGSTMSSDPLPGFETKTDTAIPVRITF